MNFFRVYGTVGWVRTDDLLIHNPYQVIDFFKPVGNAFAKTK